MGDQYVDDCPGNCRGFHFALSTWPITCPRCRAVRPKKEVRDGGKKEETEAVDANVPSV
jgi:hypothetical protein